MVMRVSDRHDQMPEYSAGVKVNERMSLPAGS